MKQKVNLLLICIGFLVSISPGFSGTVQAYVFDEEGRFRVGGYLEHYIGVRLSPGAPDLLNEIPNEDYLQDRGDLSISRSTLFIDFDATFSDAWAFKVIARGYYESMWAIDDDLYQPPEDDHTRPNRDALNMESDVDLREYYLTYTSDHLVLRFGRMQLPWGEADSIRIADVINPLDLSWDWSFPMWEDIRIPLHMLDVKFIAPNSAHALYLEAVWVPDFRTHQYAAPGATWDFLTLIGVPTINADAVRDQQSADLPPRGFDEFQGGMRLGARLNEWDVTVFGYYGRDPLGVNTLNFNNPTLAEWHFPKVFNLGATAGGYFRPLNSALRMEMAYTFNQPFQRRNFDDPGFGFGAFNNIGVGGVDYDEKDTFAYMVGFDHHHMFPSLNRTKSFWFSGQFFQKFVFDYNTDKPEEQLQTFLDEDDQGDLWTVASLLINTEYYEGKIEPQVLGVYFFDSHSGFFDGHITYKHNYTLKFVLGCLIIGGNENNAGLYWGPVQQNDQLYFKVRWTF